MREDFRELDSRVIMRTAWHVEQLILLQSVTGHAHMGHGLFHGLRFANTTEDDVARALRLDPDVVKADRQELIDEIKDYAEQITSGGNNDSLLGNIGEPLLRIGTFRNLKVDPLGVLQGLYLGGLRDDPAIRSEAEKRYSANIGWGQSYLVNKKVMHMRGLSGDILAQHGHARELDEFRKVGLIVDEPGEDVSYMYIRHKAGSGASDDAAIVLAGKLYGFSAAVGVFLADAIDTLEKYATLYADQDSGIANFIAEMCSDLGVGIDDACKIAYLAAIPTGNEHNIPDSSLRGLLEIDRKYDICALESHLLYVEGKHVPEIELDHGQTTNVRFYRYIDEILNQKI